jgi:CBS domain containing-hemolysin-like protein
LISVLHIVLGELAPKSIAIQKAEKTTIIVAYPLHFFYIIFRPFIFILNGLAGVLLRMFGIEPNHGSTTHTTDELKYLIQQSSESGTIESEEYDIIRNAFDFSDRSVKQIMIPRNQVAYLNIDKFDDAELERLLDEGYSRIPCYENDVDNIVGLIHIKDLLKSLRKNEEIIIRDLLRPVIIAPENKKVGILLKEFQQKHIHMAVIVNEFGTVEGIVTMEDIIEEIVGEIQDEYDHENPIVETIDKNVFVVFATAPLNDINSFLPYPIPVGENNDTLAGVLLEEFGDIPKEGETIQIDHYNVEILEREGNKLISVKLSIINAPEDFVD